MNHSKVHQNSGAKDGVKEFIEPSKSEHSSNDVPNCSMSHSEEVKKDNICDDLYESDARNNTQENVGNIDTLFDEGNSENISCTLTFAPGENQRPLSIYQDIDS